MLDIKQIETFYPEYLRKFKRNLLREYLQYKILEFIFDSEFGGSLVFMGGTAAHIIHGNTRFSEDLDFDNTGLDGKNFERLAVHIEKRLEREGYTVMCKTVLKKAYTCSVRIPKALYDNGLSAHEGEVLLIKVDTEPQDFGYTPDKVIINKFDVFTRISAAPAGLLLSQKICAIFNRKRPVGRDFFDLLYLLGKAKPDERYLQEKLGARGMQDIKERLLHRCAELDFKQLARDVEPFLFNPGDAKKVLLFREFIQSSAFPGSSQ